MRERKLNTAQQSITVPANRRYYGTYLVTIIYCDKLSKDSGRLPEGLLMLWRWRIQSYPTIEAGINLSCDGSNEWINKTSSVSSQIINHH